MSDTTKIEPGLSAEEWAKRYAVRPEGTAMWPIHFHDGELRIPVTASVSLDMAAPRTLVAMIAACNALLPVSDPRKITRQRLRSLRESVETSAEEGIDEDDTLAFVDALASYLPPEG